VYQLVNKKLWFLFSHYQWIFLFSHYQQYRGSDLTLYWLILMSRLWVWRPGNRWSISGRGRNDSVTSSVDTAVAPLSRLPLNGKWSLLLSCNATWTWNWPLTSIWYWFYLRMREIILPHPETPSRRAALSTGEIIHSCYAQQQAAIICASVM
jgi:hypothetical protein